MSDRVLDFIVDFSIMAMITLPIILIVIVSTQLHHHKDNRPVCGWNYKTISVKPPLKGWVAVKCDYPSKHP